MDDPKINIYRGQDGDIDYETPVAEMAIGYKQVSIPDQNLPPNTIWHFVRRQTSECGLESADSQRCIVVIDADGNIVGRTPNRPTNIMIERLSGGRFRLRWRYLQAGQEIVPTGFKIYADSGDGFDFGSPTAVIPYNRAVEYGWESAAFEHGRICRFIIRSYYKHGGESNNTNAVGATADTQGPPAATGLSISWGEL
jgi:hypothetical protein